jgi:hypothetical protein
MHEIRSNLIDTNRMIPSTSERRKYRRFRYRGEIEISWAAPDGNACKTVGNCIDLSLFGASVETPCSISPGTELELHARTVSVEGIVTVTHCRPYGAWFRLGLRFAKAVRKSENFSESTELDLEI